MLPARFAYTVAGLTVWERPSGAVFWGLIALAVVFVVLFGVRALLKAAARDRLERRRAEKRSSD